MSRLIASSTTTTTPPTTCSAFCDCAFPQSQTLITYRGHIADLVSCRCGETADTNDCTWLWHTKSEDIANAVADTAATTTTTTIDNNALIAVNGKDITFHPSYSRGTAIVRGNKPLAAGMIHFWEMRIITALAGTDVMFGIGTDQLQLDAFQFHFVSALGTNTQSWGYSFHGQIQHNGIQCIYGQPFSQGCIVGVMLDLTRGHLEYFLNRQSMGIAYTNIPIAGNNKLYPMVCSTAARSCVRLISAVSVTDCLQYRALKLLARQSNLIAEMQQQLPGLRALIRKNCFLALTAPAAGKQHTSGDSISNSCSRTSTSKSTSTSSNNIDKPASDNTNDESAMRSRLTRKQKFRHDDCDTIDNIDNCSSAQKIPPVQYNVSTELAFDKQQESNAILSYS